MKRALLLLALAGCGGTYPFTTQDAAETVDAGAGGDAGTQAVYTGCVDPLVWPCGCYGSGCPAACSQEGIGCCRPAVWACCEAHGGPCQAPCWPDSGRWSCPPDAGNWAF